MLKRFYFRFYRTATLAIFAIIHLTVPTCGQITHQRIPLDCGGWFTSLVAHPSGRIYGFGDVVGAYRTDNARESWQCLNGGLTTWDEFISGIAVAPSDARGDTLAFRSWTNLFTSTDGGVKAQFFSGIKRPVFPMLEVGIAGYR